MTGLVRRWWPAAAALLILLDAGESLWNGLPGPSDPESVKAERSTALDSLARVIARARAQEALAAADSSGQGLDPFRLPGRSDRGGGGRPARAPVAPPERRYVLHGTVGGRVATISDNSGRKRIVEVGETLDSARVVDIRAGSVLLRDRAGRFELTLEPGER